MKRDDLIGQKFGRLTILSFDGVGSQGHARWLAECICGNKIVSSGHNLKAGRVQSCGCLAKEQSSALGKSTALDLEGKKFNKLLVLSREDKDKWGNYIWKAQCDCGNTVFVKGRSLTSNKTKSCGCLRAEKAALTGHGRILPNGEALIRSKLHVYKRCAKRRNLFWNLSDEQAFQFFKSNCYYCGAQPRKVEYRWFATPAYINGIDRVDNSLGYEKSNCVAACKKCQNDKHSCTVAIAYKVVEFEENKKRKKAV